jgi:hypothetical protein
LPRKIWSNRAASFTENINEKRDLHVRKVYKVSMKDSLNLGSDDDEVDAPMCALEAANGSFEAPAGAFSNSGEKTNRL